MCFSATASFTLGAILLSTGGFATITAAKSYKNYLLLGLIPIFFGIQQGTEGIIWQQLVANNQSNASFWSYFYLFFAFYFWPAYIPLCAYSLETNLLRKKILVRLIMAGALLGTIIYLPILLGIISAQASIVGHSIQYDVYQSIPLIWLYTICYVLILIASLLVSSAPRINLLGIFIFISSIISYWCYYHAFTSIWCFFSAAISIYIAYIVYRLPIK